MGHYKSRCTNPTVDEDAAGGGFDNSGFDNSGFDNGAGLGGGDSWESAPTGGNSSW